MKLFDTETFIKPHNDETFDAAYTFIKIKDREIMLPKIMDFNGSDSPEWKRTLKTDLKIECAFDNSLVDSDCIYQIFYDEDYKKISNEEINEMLMDVVCSYSNLLVSGCTDAGINMMNILFPIYYEKSEYGEILKPEYKKSLKNEYICTLNTLLASGHYSGAYFEALHLMCSDNEKDRLRGDERMDLLREEGNPLAEKRVYYCKQIYESEGNTEITDNQNNRFDKKYMKLKRKLVMEIF